MKSLTILRHGEAASARPNESDLDRPLTKAGVAHARSLGTVIRQPGLAPQRVLCSPAVRAQQTATTLMEGGELQAELAIVDGLYNAAGETLLAEVQSQDTALDRILLVGHLPGVAQLVNLLTTEHIDLSLIYQAGTLAEVVLGVDNWADADIGTGALRLLLPP